MPYFKDQSGLLHYLDNQDDANKYLPKGCILITDQEAISLQNAQSIPDLTSQAKAELSLSDMVALRCFKAGISFPIEWQNYVSSLRDIVQGYSKGPLPTKPIYPAGT